MCYTTVAGEQAKGHGPSCRIETMCGDQWNLFLSLTHEFKTGIYLNLDSSIMSNFKSNSVVHRLDLNLPNMKGSK